MPPNRRGGHKSDTFPFYGISIFSVSPTEPRSPKPGLFFRQGADCVSAPTRQGWERRAGDLSSAPCAGIEHGAITDPTHGAGPDANSNNNVRGDMPFDEPFGERLQRSSQLSVVLLGHRHCQ